MVAVTVIAVGKIKEKWMTQGIDEYLKRLSPHCSAGIVEIPEHRLPLKASDAQVQEGLEKEGERILGQIPPRAKVIALCIEGKQLSSSKLSTMLEDYGNQTSKVAFIIGSSHGLSDKVKAKADFKLSLSPMTFPHQLTRLLLCEQVYRAASIIVGTKYHK